MNNNMLKQNAAIFTQNGLKVTPQRMAIYEFLKQTNTHPPAEIIFNHLSEEYPNISIATIYNNLKAFKQAGLVNELTFGENLSRFEVNTEEHCHVICQECGEISDLFHPQMKEFKEYARSNSKYNILFQNLVFHGLCENCNDEILV